MIDEFYQVALNLLLPTPTFKKMKHILLLPAFTFVSITGFSQETQTFKDSTVVYSYISPNDSSLYEKRVSTYDSNGFVSSVDHEKTRIVVNEYEINLKND